MRKESFILAGLFAAFAAISLLVWLTRGQNHALLKKKLKIGAMILTLTGVITTGCNASDTTCYVAIAEDYILFDDLQHSSGAIVLNLDETNRLDGTLENLTTTVYSFRITDGDGNEVQRDQVVAEDGEFDDHTEEFYLEVDPNLPAGQYVLLLYPTYAQSQEGANPLFQTHSLRIERG
jgi:hypothetical protein